ncbi:MAG: VTT domain-containing protein [Lentisphaerae bacterium]|jgi:uncharacterized membrane protein YdjX (TVP38/TMEM64 family)|nr:VTT domain-containing protein [Lentisphaerota bacterium]
MNANDIDNAPSPGGPWRLVLAGLLVALAVLVPFVLFGASIEAWTGRFIDDHAAHPGVLAAVLGGLLAGDILLPVPSSLISTACGRCLGFLTGTLVSCAGMTVSAGLGYLAGWSASPLARRVLHPREAATLASLHGRWGIGMLAAVRPVPVLAEASVVFAGLSRLPWRRALPRVLLANLVVSACYAAIGALARGRHATLLAFAAAALLSGLLMCGMRGCAPPRHRAAHASRQGPTR